jgi:hypothetical protein
MKTDPATTNRPPAPLSRADRAAYEAWLDGIVSLPEAAKLRGDIHPDTLKRSPEIRDKLLKLSARRVGIRRRHALMLD